MRELVGSSATLDSELLLGLVRRSAFALCAPYLAENPEEGVVELDQIADLVAQATHGDTGERLRLQGELRDITQRMAQAIAA